MTEFPLFKAFELIEPGPVVLVSTSENGKANVMTMTWHMVLEFSPMIGCVIGPWDHTFHALKNTGECVLSIPAVDMAEKVVEIGSCSGQDVDKFEKFGLTKLPASEVQAPLIGECMAHIECRVVDYIEKYSIFILDGVKAWMDYNREEKRTFHANGDGTFYADGELINLREKMLKLPDGV